MKKLNMLNSSIVFKKCAHSITCHLELRHRQSNMFPFKGPCCVVISGITNSGKTTFVKRLLENKNDMFDPKPLNVTYFYGQFQNTFNEMEQDMPFIQFEQGLPDQDKIIELSNPDTHSLFIIDD